MLNFKGGVSVIKKHCVNKVLCVRWRGGGGGDPFQAAWLRKEFQTSTLYFLEKPFVDLVSGLRLALMCASTAYFQVVMIEKEYNPTHTTLNMVRGFCH